MEAIVSLEHGTCMRLILQLGNLLVSDSYQFHVSPYFSIQLKSALIVCTLHYWYSLNQHFQFNCHASSCLSEVSLQTIHLQYCNFLFPVSFHTHLIHHPTSLSCVSFVSMMVDTSRPSFDEYFPFNFNTSSEN
jgi:hypothetical protein